MQIVCRDYPCNKRKLLEIHLQGRRKQLESGEAMHGVRRISIQEVLFSYLIVAEGNSAAKAAHSRGSGGMPPRKILKFSSSEIAF